MICTNASIAFRANIIFDAFSFGHLQCRPLLLARYKRSGTPSYLKGNKHAPCEPCAATALNIYSRRRQCQTSPMVVSIYGSFVHQHVVTTDCCNRTPIWRMLTFTIIQLNFLQISIKLIASTETVKSATRGLRRRTTLPFLQSRDDQGLFESLRFSFQIDLKCSKSATLDLNFTFTRPFLHHTLCSFPSFASTVLWLIFLQTY